jgi:hypothetical protein
MIEVYSFIWLRGDVMVAVKLLAVVGEDRQLVIHVPDEVPLGPVELVIHSTQESPAPSSNPDREAARAKLLAADVLLTHVEVPEDAVPLTLQERLRIGKMPPGVRPSEELTDEDRGAW